MIEHINDATERTHRITGLPREEIVRRPVQKRDPDTRSVPGRSCPA
ncbi:hypothetical protein [Bradyrhizobium liaoningense]|nr:hypothetical protein [Bradyrhizobium liaoningense]MBR0719211.1 hypothetical protein [Bradyrhizobium liaoningense]